MIGDAGSSMKFAMFLLVVALAGCAADPGSMPPDEPLDEPNPEPDPARRSQPPPRAQPPESFDFKQLSLNGCQRYGSVSDLPHALFPEIVPSGWKDRNPIPLSALFYSLLDCERFSWGGFERGPFQMVRENHSHFTAPGKCREGDYDEPYVLSKLLVSDAEVAQELSAHWGIPVGVVVASHEGPSGFGSNAYDVKWKGPEGVHADLTHYVDGPGPNRLARTDRYYALGEDGVASIDWTREYTLASAHEEWPMINGTIGPGTLYHKMLGEQYLALGGVMFDVNISATVTIYEDLECES